MNSRTFDRYSQDAQSPSASGDNPLPLARSLSSGFINQDYSEEDLISNQLDARSTSQDSTMSYPYYGQGPGEPVEHQHRDITGHYSTPEHGSMPPPVQQHTGYAAVHQFGQRQPTTWERMTQQFHLTSYERPIMREIETIEEPRDMYPPADAYPYSDLSVPKFLAPTVPADPSKAQMMLHQEHNERNEAGNSRASLEEGQQQYEAQLKTTFEAIIAGRVREARAMIVNLTRWLLSTVEARGLHHDNEEGYEQRLAMWREFNHCWEALGLKQRDITERALQTKESPSDILTSQDIIDMVNQLVAQCDQIEQYGLVDYEMGVWEEQIVAIFIICLNLLNRPDSRTVIMNPDSVQI